MIHPLRHPRPLLVHRAAASARWGVCLAVVLAVLTPAARAADDHEQAAQTVAELQDALIQAMKAGAELDFQQRYDRLRPIVERTHDLPFTARAALGPAASELDQEQMRRYLERFAELSVASYAEGFRTYNNQRFAPVDTRVLQKGRVLVRTRLIRPEGEPVPFDYILHRRSDQWQIISIVVGGVSDLALKHAEYTRVLQKQGFERLMQEIERKIAALRDAAE